MINSRILPPDTVLFSTSQLSLAVRKKLNHRPIISTSGAIENGVSGGFEFFVVHASSFASTSLSLHWWRTNRLYMSAG
jgi:hypothetical protein